jgi:hypothetical protein
MSAVLQYRLCASVVDSVQQSSMIFDVVEAGSFSNKDRMSVVVL